ncbi:glutamyl-tRNA reductase [Lentzea fradiae]|uniref:Glutamyl-tRNA reductase n=1 Tax=Lentzea fradiae TaxID=200378 RepID=A0A1G7L9S7_9PSEU|nr:glutamyl-tRNA reductase [Lentzea fradiae]SDF46248.1 glutamyl-tRNA reductase [Lentzea fradiae]
MGDVKLTLLGISHSSAPVDVLERVVISGEELDEVLSEINSAEEFGAVYALSTCNRMEFYVEKRADEAASLLRARLVERLGLSEEDASRFLYQREGTDAVRHLYSVSSGLESIVIGEDQILGQVKDALDRSRRLGTAGPLVNQLVQSAIRLGKRVRTETDINRAGRSLATVGLSALEHVVGAMSGRSALVVGAGAMAGVVVAALRGSGLARIDVANRTPEKAARLAETTGGSGFGLDELPRLLADVDLVVTCISGTGALITAADAEEAVRHRDGSPLFLLDLALPRNIAGDVAKVDGVSLVDLETLAGAGPDEAALSSVASVRALIDGEVETFLAAQRAAKVAPALVKLRTVASTTAEAELGRLFRKVPTFDEQHRSEITLSVHRIVEKVLHGPTVRARELAGAPDGSRYVEVLGKLFDVPGERDEVVA